MSIALYEKIKLKSGKTGRVVEILEKGVMYLAEIYNHGKRISIEHVEHQDIESVFKEVEFPVGAGSIGTVNREPEPIATVVVNP